jgi:hypothetical protein
MLHGRYFIAVPGAGLIKSIVTKAVANIPPVFPTPDFGTWRPKYTV